MISVLITLFLDQQEIARAIVILIPQDSEMNNIKGRFVTTETAQTGPSLSLTKSGTNVYPTYK